MARTVLVVDDNIRICELLTEFLANQDYAVLCANEGAEALAMLDGQTPDLAVIDLLLDGNVSGDDVIDRAIELRVPVVTMSGALASDRRGRDLRTKHLQKPFKMAALQSAIDSLLEQ